MKKCALYRCKQCFATMTDEGDVIIGLYTVKVQSYLKVANEL